MNVLEIVNPHFRVLYPDSSLRDAVIIFQEDRVGTIPVVNEEEKLVGAFSRYSLFRALLQGADLSLSIEPFLIRDVFTGRDHDTVFNVSRQMRLENLAHAVIVDKDRKVKGLLTQLDINRTWGFQWRALDSSVNVLFQHMQTGAIVFDVENRILIVNPVSENLLQISAGDFLNKPISTLLPDWNDWFPTGRFPAEESHLHKMTIEEKNILATVHFVPAQEKSWGGFVLLQDLTDYEKIASELESTKKLEQTLEAVVETIDEGYLLVKENGAIALINRAACEMAGKTKEQLTGLSYQEIFPELRLQECFEQGLSHQGNIEVLLIGRRRCLVTKIPIYSNSGISAVIVRIVYRNLKQWKEVIQRLDSLEQEVSYYRAELSVLGGSSFDIDSIVSRNEAMTALKEYARQIAPGFSNVLLLGESGTGKELFARGIHYASNRPGRFVKINCAAVPMELWESEFFGYAEGAFTGAKRGGKPGKFEQANNGTLFLDEIGDMPLAMQVKLLRVLQEREFERVGGNETIYVNVRIIGATNKNLKDMVLKGEFREDLYYRLNVLPLTIPPLRERLDDVPLLASAISKKISHMMGLDPVSIHPDAMKLLTSYHWPGNVRELENVIERALNTARGNILTPDDFPEYLKSPPAHPILKSDMLSDKDTSLDMSHHPEMVRLEELEQQAIVRALEKVNGKRTAAAKLLGISRSQLYKKMERFGIH